MSRRFWFALVLLIPLGLLTAASKEVKLVRLSVINKGPLPLGLRLQSQDSELFYYLTVPGGGSKEFPVEKEFTVQTGTYNLLVNYIEYYDPVYGFQCSSSAMRLNITSNSRLVFLPCGQRPPNSGEPTQWKFWPYKIRKFHFPCPF
jgi:hypothetical protein